MRANKNKRASLDSPTAWWWTRKARNLAACVIICAGFATMPGCGLLVAAGAGAGAGYVAGDAASDDD